MLRIVAACGALMWAGACYQSHGLDPRTSNASPDAGVDSAAPSMECDDTVFVRGECNACPESSTVLRRCGSRAYTDGFIRAVFDLDGCDRMRLISCAVWEGGTDTHTCVPPERCSDLDVTNIEDLLGSGRFYRLLDDFEAPSCEALIAAAPDC